MFREDKAATHPTTGGTVKLSISAPPLLVRTAKKEGIPGILVRGKQNKRFVGKS